MTTKPIMIFHVPYPLQRDATSGSGIRPVRMRDAFTAAGYDVWEVSGYARERGAQIREIKRKIRGGARVEFVYSESSTMPTPMTEPHHIPLHPWLDLAFLRFCRKHGIPTGVFYRDIYWQFPEYRNSVSAPIAMGTRFFYRRDLRLYRSSVDLIFLPSDKMGEYLPATNQPQGWALPPGSAIVDEPRIEHEGLEMLFVGGLGEYYRAQQCVSGVAEAKHAHLTLCTRAEQWDAVKPEYEPLLGTTTTVVHESGAGLKPLFARADLGVLFLEPIEYREFAAPLKLYEYLGNAKPIVATEGSLAGLFVKEHGIGWVLPYEASSLADLLDWLGENPDELAAVVERCRVVREENTWEARAKQAAAALKQKAPH